MKITVLPHKKQSKRKRRKWMKRFEKAFLGSKISKKRIRILNPEVIWFEENKDLLSAHAVDNIKILNEETGYELQVALDQFTLSKNEDVTYIGKLFFRDIIEQLKRPDKIEKNRSDIFLNSQQLFFKALNTKHPILDQQFEYGIASKSLSGELAYKKLNWQELQWDNTSSKNTFLIDSSDFLTVQKKDIITKNYEAMNAYKLRLAASFLKSNTGKFIFNENGELLNKKDIEESGYWTNHRIAKTLPVEYNGNISFDKQQHTVVKQLVDYETKHSPEKIYIHTDKNIYFPYETLWFKAYVLNAVDHTPSELSDVVYVELLNTKNKLIHSWILHEDLGYSGDYTWNPNFKSGDYILRAYTNHMRNYDSCYFFEKKLEVRNPSVGKDQQKEMFQDSISIEFFPEGGDLVAGISSYVTVKATTIDGMPINVHAQLMDEQGNSITKFQTIHKGLGILNFIPKDNQTYILHTEHKGSTYQFDLPKPKQSGISLEIKATQKDYVIIQTKTLIDQDLAGAYLVGHVRGKIFAYLTDLNGNDYKLSKSSIPTGVVHFTVFDKQNRPQSERLIFNEYGYNQPFIQFDSKNNLHSNDNYHFKIDSIINEEMLDLSASVVDVTGAKTNNNFNIKSYLFLHSDLEDNIPDAHEYLKESTASNLYYLDLYMRSVYWRRFNWKDIIENHQDTLEFHAEKNFSISGYTTKADKDDPITAEITMNTLGPSIIYNQIRTEDNGHFSFRDIPIADSSEIFLQARINKGQDDKNSDKVQLTGNRLVDIHLDTFTTEHIQTKQAYIEEKQDSNSIKPDITSL